MVCPCQQLSEASPCASNSHPAVRKLRSQRVSTARSAGHELVGGRRLTRRSTRLATPGFARFRERVNSLDGMSTSRAIGAVAGYAAMELAIAVGVAGFMVADVQLALARIDADDLITAARSY